MYMHVITYASAASRVNWRHGRARHWADDRTRPRAAVPLCLHHAPHGEPGRDTAVGRHPAAQRSAGDSVQHSRGHRAPGRGESAQLEHTLAIDQTTKTRSLKLLERELAIERVPHPDGRIKAMTLTSKGRKAFAAGLLASGRRQEAQADSGPEPCPAKAHT